MAAISGGIFASPVRAFCFPYQVPWDDLGLLQIHLGDFEILTEKKNESAGWWWQRGRRRPPL
jgi:hypothetical protein